MALTSLSLKILNNYRIDYNYNLLSCIRFFVIFFISYLILKFQKNSEISFTSIKNKKWFIIRISSNHLSLFFFTTSLFFIRLSTCICIFMIYPIFINIFSISIFKEKFDKKYLLACLICFIGSICFSFSEKNSVNLNPENSMNLNIFLGIFFAVISGFFSSFLSISSKILMNEMDSLKSNMLVGFYLCILGFIFSLFNFKSFLNDLTDILFIFYSVLNGIFINCAFYFFNIGIQNLEISKVSYSMYSQVVFTIIFGVVFCGENFFLLDFIGSLMILGTNIYLIYSE